MSILVRFKFRTPGKNKRGERLPNSNILYIHLRVNGVECNSLYTSKVKVDPKEWNQKMQMVMGRSKLAQEINNKLRDIVAAHLAIMNRMISLGKTPTAEGIKTEYLEGITPKPLLVQLYDRLLQNLEALSSTDQARATTTMKAWTRGRSFLKMFLESKKKSKDIDFSDVTIAWAREYHKWLMTYEKPEAGKERQKSDTANKYLSFVRAVLDHAVEYNYIEHNTLDKLVIKGNKPRPVYFLEDHHLAKLKGFPFDEENDLFRDWVLLACYTGLDYPDLLDFVRDPFLYIVITPTGKRKIVTDRMKTRIEAQIPLLNGVMEILEKYSYQVPIKAADQINRWLRFYKGLIGFKEPTLSLKICRKTAGALFLNEGYSLEVVQKILGHTRITTTQRYYVKIIDKRVDREMDRIGVEFV